MKAIAIRLAVATLLSASLSGCIIIDGGSDSNYSQNR